MLLHQQGDLLGALLVDALLVLELKVGFLLLRRFRIALSLAALVFLLLGATFFRCQILRLVPLRVVVAPHTHGAIALTIGFRGPGARLVVVDEIDTRLPSSDDGGGNLSLLPFKLLGVLVSLGLARRHTSLDSNTHSVDMSNIGTHLQEEDEEEEEEEEFEDLDVDVE